MSKSRRTYARPELRELARPRAQGRRFLQKTTLMRQVLGNLKLAAFYTYADGPTLRGREWIKQQWESARLVARDASRRSVSFTVRPTSQDSTVKTRYSLQSIEEWT